MFRSRHTPGFTLLEVVVVLGICLLLLALLLPAVQRVREAVNQTTCSSRLGQLALAAHAFHNDTGRLPPGYLGPSKEKELGMTTTVREGQWLGHLPLLLPYLEGGKGLLEQLAHAVSFELNTVTKEPWWRTATGGHPNTATYRVARASLRIFQCPSVPNYLVPIGQSGAGTVLGFHVFHTQRGGRETLYWSDTYEGAEAFHPLGRTHYLGVAGTGVGNRPEDQKWEGLYTNRSRHSLGSLTTQDGASATLLYAEAVGTRPRPLNDPLRMDVSWVGGGSLGTYYGLNRGQGGYIDTFASVHARGVAVAMADASARWLRHADYVDAAAPGPMISWYVLQQLAGIRDGGLLDTRDILD